MQNNKSLPFFLILLTLLLMLTGCAAKDGRVSVILDNSGSMTSAGTSFRDIKQSLLDALMLIPNSYEKGLRVFDDSGSSLVSPYHRDLNPLRSRLKYIEPGGGTYIGKSLSDAATDLLEKPSGNNRLILITDGEGDNSDIQAAQEVKARLANLEGRFKCNFILFSKRKNVLKETPIGRVSEILGCDLTVPDDYASAPSLTTALNRILGFDFYWIWIIISAIAYIVLLCLSANLVFSTQCAQGALPRYARLSAITFLFSLLPLVMGAHIIGFFGWLSNFVWLLAILALAILIIAGAGLGKNYIGERNKKDEDPFA